VVKIFHSLYTATCPRSEQRQQKKIPCDGKAKLPILTSFPIYAASATNNKERIPQMLCLPCFMPISNKARPCFLVDPRNRTPYSFPAKSACTRRRLLSSSYSSHNHAFHLVQCLHRSYVHERPQDELNGLSPSQDDTSTRYRDRRLQAKQASLSRNCDLAFKVEVLTSAPYRCQASIRRSMMRFPTSCSDIPRHPSRATTHHPVVASFLQRFRGDMTRRTCRDYCHCRIE
jgi:hypothetical protein